MRKNKKDLFDIAVQIAINKGIITEEITLDYELSGKIDDSFQLVSKEKVLLTRIKINEINSVYFQPNVQNKPKELKISWENSRKYSSFFLYYGLGIVAPILISGIFTLFRGAPFLADILFVLGISIHFLFRKFLTKIGFLKKKRPLTPEALLFIVAIFYWGYFSLNMALTYPTMTVEAQTSAAKNLLVNVIKECVVNQADNKPTTFKDVRTFSDGQSTLKSFDIKPIDPNTCFKARAIPKNNKKHTWFEIYMDEKTGEATKTCGDPSKPGCDEGNTW